MKRFVRIFILSALAVLTSCIKEADPIVETYPEGTPVTLNIGFGAIEQLDVQIGTKAGATIADESRVHDLYVLIFDKSGKKFYGRYFTYEHMISTLATLDSQNNEGWYVENTQMSDTEVKTKGVVKISTESKSECTLVLLANVSNAITKLNGKDPIDCLAELSTLNQLNNVQVTLEQQTVNRNDLFLMMGTLAVNTGEMVWGELPSKYNDTYKVPLRTLDAKIQFRITYDTNNIDSIDPRYWQVYNVPSKSYLTSHVADPTDVSYFNTSEAYFEDVVTENTNTYHVFTFYMLENRPAAKANIEDLDTPNYYLRDTQEKEDNQDGTFTNGAWVYAPDRGTYVKFSAVLHLTDNGIDGILGAGSSTKHALTSDGLFYVHLGHFTSSDSSKSHNYDDYTVNRGYAYTYNIRIINSTKIYVEVCGDAQGIREDEAGQEGSLLLTSEEIINCDAHYEYHSIGFKYDSNLAQTDYQKQISWHIKTPFAEGGPEFNTSTGWYDCPADMDIAWVKFGLNGKNKEGKYKKARAAYPGINETNPNYYPKWYPGNEDASKGPTGDDIPALLDVNQLINLLIDQSKKKCARETNLFDSADSLRFTAFIDEYYYEENPITGDMDPDLWRSFVNASPRELHILANAQYSADQQSDVITSSHSIIQQSIQTIYNIYSPNLSSIWGTEHIDEMKDRVKTGWPWTAGETSSINANYCKDSENGRYNTAALWGLNPTNTSPQWNTFLNYEVDNNEPELNTDYQGMAFSCMTRNRDNDGDGTIDPKELRWYLASINQLIGLWVGNESLSPSARIYQPANEASNVETDWRAHVVSSTTASITGPLALVGEEGVSIYTYDSQRWQEAFGGDDSDETWNKVQSVRCVRNIGTYKTNGKTKDISDAPFDTRPDQYFEAPQGVDADNRILPNDDGTYTLRFTNLNTRSLREYTSEDLPFHSEYSKHNCVYLELHMQNPTVTAMEDNTINVTMLNLNKDISSKGYNEYCPTGYRLPNMTELAMMQAWLPSSYWPRVNNTRYGEAPCRTYYAKGYYCSKNTFNESGVPTTYYYSSEADKVGWTYDRSNMHLSNVNAQVKYVRCVRDKNLTGDITGKVSVPDGNALTVGTPFEIDLNFSSMASALTDLALYLVYTTTDGVENTLTIPSSNVQLSGVTLRDELTYTIPDTVPILGSMAIRAVLRNSAGISRSFETEITVLSPVTAAIKLLNVEYDKDVMNPPFPVLCTTSSPSSQITKWTLSITDPAGEKTEVVLPDLADKYYRYYTYYYDYGQTLQTGVYTFQLETEIENGPATRSAVAKMEILKEDFWPNPTPTDQLSSAADVTVSWGPELIDGIDFSAGDFIETTMDLTNCIFKVNTSVVETATEADEPTEKEKEGKTEEEIAQKREEKRQKRVEQEHRDTDLGLDNLFSIGIGTIGWYSNTFHLYYPAHDNNLSYERMLFRPQETDGVYKQYPTSSGDQDLNRFDYRIDKTGIYWNNQKLNLSDWGTNQRVIMSNLFNRLITSTSLYIGSTEGKHRSRAGYRFVRVVYNGSSTNIHNDDYSGDFDADPIDGGNL